jgi:hypothetical protein
MANTIILKRSATPGKVPTTAQLALGEIAINTYDGLIYIKKNDGTESIAQIGGVTSVNGETGALTIDTGDVAENGNLYFTTARARAAISAGTGISYNSSTGAISTTQNLSTAGSPSFAGLTLTGNVGITGSIIPSADITFDLGSPTKQWKDIYVGPGSLYVNGQKVLQDDSGTITFSADTDENIRIKTLGTGILQLGTSTTVLQVDSTLQLASGKNITDAAGIKVNFGDNIEMNGNKVIGLGAPSANSDAATKAYVDSTVAAISTSSITQGNSNITVTDTGSGTVLVTVDGSTALTVDASGVTVAGNFTVSGTQTVVNSNTLSLADNIITLNSDATGAPTQNAGIEVKRGDEANTQIRWNEGSDTWTFTNDGAVYHPIATSTDVLTEGSTNLYHTTARARGAVNASSSTGVSYNSSTGTISLGSIPNSSLANNSITINGTSVALGGTRTLDTDAISEGTNQYFTSARARSAISFTAGSGAYNSTTGVVSIPTNTNQLTNGANFATEAFVTSAVAGKDNTDEVTEGSTNLFFTNARARAAVSAGTGISYNSSTGVITNTITQYTDALAVSANTSAIATAKSEAISAAASAAATAIANAVAAKDNTDEITEGSTNLYFTNARAVSANTSAIATAKSEAISTAASDATTKANNAQSAAISSAASDATTKANNAQSAAISSAASDATTKANAAKPVAGTGISVSGTTVTNTLSTSGGTIGGSLSVQGSITATGEITAYYSDARLKTNVSKIDSALDKVMAINGYTYDSSELAQSLGLPKHMDQIGLMADEVEAVLPELVTQSAIEGYKTIRYDKVVSVLVNAIKEQQAMIEELRKDVKKTLH